MAPIAKAAKAKLNPLEALAKMNPALAAQISNAVNGKIVDVTAQVARKVDSSAPIENPCQIVCVVRKARITDSFTANEDGDMKDVTYEWDTPTPQLIVTFADDKAPRHNTHFFNLQGFMSYVEIEEMLAEAKQRPEDAGITKGSKGYALITTAAGTLDRIPSEQKTDDCLEIVSRFLTSVGLDGFTIQDAVDNINEAIDNSTPLKLVVKFGFGKEYINTKGIATKSIEPKKYLKLSVDGDVENTEEETFEEHSEFDDVQA